MTRRSLALALACLASLALVPAQMARASEDCGNGVWACDRTNPAATCAAAKTYKDCFYANNGACASKDPASFYFPQCHGEFGWTADGVVYSAVNGPIETGLIDSIALQKIAFNPSLPGYLLDENLLARKTAAGVPLLAELELARMPADAAGQALVRRAIRKVFTDELGVKMTLWEGEAATTFQCAPPNSCALEYVAGSPPAVALLVNGGRFDASQLEGTTISLEGGNVPTLFVGEDGRDRDFTIECQGERVKFRSDAGSQVVSLGCAAVGGAAELRTDANLTIEAERRPLLHTDAPQIIRLLPAGHGVDVQEAINLLDGGDVRVVGNPGPFTLDENCRTFEWHDDGQGLVPAGLPRASCTVDPLNEWTFEWNDDLATVASDCVIYDERKGSCWALAPGASPVIDPHCVCAGGTDPATEPPNPGPPPAPGPGPGPTPAPGGELTAANCAASIGLPTQYDLTESEMAAHCSAHGGKYCTNTQYETVCMRKAKGRPVPENPDPWVDEIIDKYNRCSGGDTVSCPVD